jgi:molybdopterin/thiamine biosynthesis adenylyltransferase
VQRHRCSAAHSWLAWAWELRLADPEEFEASNMNRQFAAYVDTIGVNKAEAVAAELARINPGLITRTFTDGVCESSIAALLDGADAVVDAIDFWALDAELLLHREACQRGQWVFTSQGAVEITTVTCLIGAIRPEEMVCVDGRPRSPKRSSRSCLCCPRRRRPRR